MPPPPWPPPPAPPPLLGPEDTVWLDRPAVPSDGDPIELVRGPQQSTRSLLARGTAWNLVGQFGPLIANLALTPYVIHGLGSNRYGLFMLANSIAAFLGTFDGGIGMSAQRYFVIYAGRGDRVATTRLLVTLVGFITALGGVVFVVLYVTAPALMKVFGIAAPLQAEGEVLLRTLAVIVGFSLVRSLFNCVLYAQSRFALTNMVQLALYLAYAVSVIITVQFGFGLRGIAVGLGVQSVLSTVLLIPPAVRYLTRDGLALLPWSELRDFLGYAWKAQGVTLSRLINATADNIVAGAFVHPVANVGRLAAGSSFAEQLRSVPNNAMLPMFTILGRAVGERGEREAVPDYARLQRFYVVVCTGWSVTAMGAAYFGLRHWLGAPFAVSGLVAAILIGGNMFNLWASVCAVWAGLVGKPGIEARYAVSTVLVNGVLTAALVLPFGIVGIVSATAAGQVLGALYLLHLCRRGLDVQIPSFLSEVPWVPALLCGLGNVVLERVVSPYLPGGPVGLLGCAVVAAPACAAFFLATLGPRRVITIVAARLPARWR